MGFGARELPRKGYSQDCTGEDGAAASYLKLTTVSPTGLLEKANQQQISLGLFHFVALAGMRIDAVDDVEGDPGRLAEALKGSGTTVRLCLRRPAMKEPEKCGGWKNALHISKLGRGLGKPDAKLQVGSSYPSSAEGTPAGSPMVAASHINAVATDEVALAAAVRARLVLAKEEQASFNARLKEALSIGIEELDRVIKHRDALRSRSETRQQHRR
mmetsp:Transcript_112816/g.240789  ORF Transcript_112816/g.240789 Transcript_112816/m.240789 type:complete len:215 (-) Transcript_112816:133-777(-)